MSQTYSIACVQCRKHIWIAQKSYGKMYVYGGSDHAAAFAAFLEDHIGHPLKFGDNVSGDIADMEEIET